MTRTVYLGYGNPKQATCLHDAGQTRVLMGADALRTGEICTDADGNAEYVDADDLDAAADWYDRHMA